MTVLRQQSDVCTVIMTVDANPEIKPELEAHEGKATSESTALRR